MVAFLVTSWLTFALAAISGYQHVLNDYHELKDRSYKVRAMRDLELPRPSPTGASISAIPPNTSVEPAPEHYVRPAYEAKGEEDIGLYAVDEPKDPRWIKIARSILAPLRYLQVATGTAILVAGLAQGSKLTYYHELFALSYWNVTLPSFWAAQIRNPKYREINNLSSLIRDFTVFCSALLSIYVQGRAIIRRYSWDPFTLGRCFLMNHGRGRER